jgi:hypothetical protein
MAAEFKIGRLRYTWKGAWVTSTFYNRDAVASFNGKTYVCLVPHTSGVFDDDYHHVELSGENKPYWVLMLDGISWKGEWAPSTPYAPGNLVHYAGTVYECTVNHTSASTINLNNWTQYVVTDSTWRGDFAVDTFYKVGDTVKYGGTVYRCITEHTSAHTEPPTYIKWEVVYSGVEYKSQWSGSNIQYKINDIVKFGPDLWISRRAHISSAPFDGTIDPLDVAPTWVLWIPGLEFNNTWDPLTVYQVGQVVIYGGYSYVSLVINNTGNVPSTTTGESWLVLTTGYTLGGDWNNSTSYKIGSVVRRDGSLYEALQDNVGQDPTSPEVTKTYNSTGSSGTTLKVNNTTGLATGMTIVGNGFDKGQYITKVVDGNTLKISQAPYSTIIDGSILRFIGVNPDNWKLVVPSVKWKNRWALNTQYTIGDIVVRINNTYKCIKNHTATPVLAPELDLIHQCWIIYLNHDRYNVLNDTGDMVVSTDGVNQALKIGGEGFLLKSVDGVPTWANVFETPNIFYVTPDGTDAPTSGTTWDNPFGSIRYACQHIANGVFHTSAKLSLTTNKDFIVEETANWMLDQISQSIPPFTSNPSIDINKTRRDSRLLIDAIIYDLSRGGNSQTIAYTLAFFDLEYSDRYSSTGVADSIIYFIATLNRLFTVMLEVLNGVAITESHQTALTQVIYSPENSEVLTAIAEFQNIVITALAAGNTSTIPPANQGLTATVMIKTGSYYESLPIIVPPNTALNGDELRGVTVYPNVTINTIATRSFAASDTFRVGTTAGMTANTPVQFVSINPVSETSSVFGNVVAGQTYYVVGGTITPTQFSVSTTPGGPIFQLGNYTSTMRVYGGDALSDMFRVRNGTGIRNMTLSGLLGTLTAPNAYTTRRPTGGSYVSLDPGLGPNDTSAWIIRKSPYIQNVTTFGVGATGLKIDGTLHNGGNKSVVCNDFTQIISDGIGIWTTGPDSLCEAVSVFAYYAYAGYFAEDGGRIRATNGNSSYGTFGVVAEGYDNTETPISGLINNRYYQATATPFSSLGLVADILKIQYSHAGEQYLTTTTNLLQYSNSFTSWTSDSNVTLIQSIMSPAGQSDGWIATGNTSGTDSSYFYQDISIAPSGAYYAGISGTNISGSGTLATFNVTVTSTEYLVDIAFGGSGYVNTNKIRILGSALGGIDTVNDLVITVTNTGTTDITGISITPTILYPNTVQVGSKQDYTFSIYCKRGSVPSMQVDATFSGYSTTTSSIVYNFATEVVTPSSSAGGFTPLTYSATPVSSAAGWYRLSFVFHDTPALNTSLQIRIYPRTKNGNSGYTVLYGSQLEIGSSVGFYLHTTTNKFTAYANYDVIGPGTGVELIGNEIRVDSVYQTRVLQDSVGYTGGVGYLASSNNAQTGDSSSITIAASDVATDKQYLGMRVFVNSGVGAGQYGTISNFDTVSKIATVLKDSFDQVTIVSTDSATDNFTLATLEDVKSLYVDQPVQFVPTVYTSVIDKVSQNSLVVTNAAGGTVNTFSVDSTARLAVGMPVTFSGATYGGVTSNFTYYILTIVDDHLFQVSTDFGGAVTLLQTSTGTMNINYPAGNSHLHGPVTHMDVNLPIYFTGKMLSSVVAGVTYYINEVFDTESEFTISSSLVTVNATDTTAVTNSITVDETAGLVPVTPIKFAGTGFGNIVADTKYYVNHVIDATHLSVAASVITTIATQTLASANLITVGSTAGFVVGNPVIITGPIFGGLINDQTYYILYVNNPTSFAISATSTPVSITVTNTSASMVISTVTYNNVLTNVTSSNLTPLTPIKFSGTTFGGIDNTTQYYVNRIINNTHFTVSRQILQGIATATELASGLITCGTTVGLVAGTPIMFGGVTFGNIQSGTVYYISAINDATTFTISALAGGSSFPVSDGTGSVTFRTLEASPTLTTASGTMTGTTRFGGNPVTLQTGVGVCTVRTTDGPFVLTTATGTLTGTSTVFKEVFEADSGSMNGSFTVPIIGGVSQGVTYYVNSITPGVNNTFSVSNIVGGSNIPLTNSTGSMAMGEVGWDHVNPGTDLVVSFDSSTVYSIEPRVTYSSPTMGSLVNTLTTLPPGVFYIAAQYGNGNFVALPASTTSISVLANGSSSWTQGLLPSSASWTDINYGNKYWVIISSGGSSIPGSKVLYSNSDLVTWKTSYLPSIASWNNVAYGNGKFVAITSNSSSSAYTTNYGTNWASGSGLANTTWSGLAYGNGRFVAVATGGTIASYSLNGITWQTAGNLPRSTTWTDVAYGNGRFVAVSSTLGKAAYSLDGITWKASLYNVKADKIAYGNGVFVAVTDNSVTVYTSEDGISWKTRTSTQPPQAIGAIAYGFTDVGVGAFIAPGGRAAALKFTLGSKTKARAVVTGGKITEIDSWESGGGYTIAPTVTIVDTNATVTALVTALKGTGVLSAPTIFNRGINYTANTTTITITGNGYADKYQTGTSLIVKSLTKLPRAGDNLSITGNTFVYKVTDAVALNGTTAPNIIARVDVSPEITTGTSPDNNTPINIRTKYSQARLTNHDYLNIGYGNVQQSNYPGVPASTVLSPENETVEANYGRVFYTTTDQDGNFKVGDLFAVEQATGIVTLSASQFGLKGLNTLKLGGVQIGGSEVIITQFSTDQTFVANSNQIVPTQRAIKGYLTARLSQGGSNTFTGQLIAGTVLVGAPDKIQSTVPEGAPGSRIKMGSKVNVHAFDGGGWDGDGMALAFFTKSLNRPVQE